MKLSRSIPWLVVLVTAMAAQAQEPGVSATAPTTNSVTEHRISTPTMVLTEPPQAPREDIITGTNYQVSGPLVGPIKAIKSKKILQAPVRLLQAVNPLAITGPEGVETRTDHLSTRAWASIAGWHPGSSHLADPVTHESEMSLLTISRTPKP